MPRAIISMCSQVQSAHSVGGVERGVFHRKSSPARVILPNPIVVANNYGKNFITTGLIDHLSDHIQQPVGIAAGPRRRGGAEARQLQRSHILARQDGVTLW